MYKEALSDIFSPFSFSMLLMMLCYYWASGTRELEVLWKSFSAIKALSLCWGCMRRVSLGRAGGREG